jgi:hypothetical protein
MTTKMELSYQQTPRERYYTPMNDQVADLIDSFPGVRVVGSGGGSMMIADMDAQVADQSFIVVGTSNNIRMLAAAIERQIDRPVGVVAV